MRRRDWQEGIFYGRQENAPPPPEISDDDFGYHYPDWFVRLCVDSLESWHVHPALWFNTPIELVYDIYRHINKQDAIRSDGETRHGNPDDTDIDFEDTVKVTL